jgi:hypothetical protein
MIGGMQQQEEEEPNLDEDMHDILNEACTRAELLKKEVDGESSKRRKAEMDLLIALQRVSFVLLADSVACIFVEKNK